MVAIFIIRMLRPPIVQGREKACQVGKNLYQTGSENSQQSANFSNRSEPHSLGPSVLLLLLKGRHSVCNRYARCCLSETFGAIDISGHVGSPRIRWNCCIWSIVYQSQIFGIGLEIKSPQREWF